MDDHSLKNLLKQADRVTPANGASRDLADMAIRLAEERRSRRRLLTRVGASTGALCVLLSILWIARPSKSPEMATDVPSTQSAQQLHQEITARDAEIERLTKLIERLEESERRTQARRRRLISTPPMDVQLERAAFVMVYQADRLAAQGLKEPAAEFYRMAFERFSESPSATRARAKLSELESEPERS